MTKQRVVGLGFEPRSAQAESQLWSFTLWWEHHSPGEKGADRAIQLYNRVSSRLCWSWSWWLPWCKCLNENFWGQTAELHGVIIHNRLRKQSHLAAFLIPWEQTRWVITQPQLLNSKAGPEHKGKWSGLQQAHTATCFLDFHPCWGWDSPWGSVWVTKCENVTECITDCVI